MAASTASSGSKRSILELPLVPRRRRFTERLLPDPLTPTPSALVSVPASSPSLLRRARAVHEGSHFTYTTPLLMEFPYSFSGEEVEESNKEDEVDPVEERKRVDAMGEEERMQYGMEKARKEMERVERLMRPYEVDPALVQAADSDDHLTGYLSKGRVHATFPSARILGVSEVCAKDCLPDLDLGDTQEWVAKHAGKGGPETYSSGPMASAPASNDRRAAARYQLSDYLSGRLIGVHLPQLDDASIDSGAERGVGEAQHLRATQRKAEAEAETKLQRWRRRETALLKRQNAAMHDAYAGYAPWSNAYSGHQFGQWAGQLGDGRAITLMETYNTSSDGQQQRWEIQLKGAGRTPYSRFADGLAVLTSSVREYLASEAMHGLRISTSRALSLIAVPDVTVMREQRNTAAVVARLAPIWVRVGSFEHHAKRGEWESVRLLGEFTCREGYGWNDVGDGSASSQPWAERLIRECVVRNARTVAEWQAYGFMHGVMNTDNISLLGLTIDYGPYGFMDVFDRYTICNKSDGEGRYSYNMQPTAALFVMEQLTTSLAAVIGFERKHERAPQPGELVALASEEINALSQKIQDDLWPTVKALFMDTLIEHWIDAWRARLALHTKRDDDRATLIDPLLDILEGYLDYTLTLRGLCQIAKHVGGLDGSASANDSANGDGKSEVEAFVDAWIDWERVPTFARDARRVDTIRWAQTYVRRLRDEQSGNVTADLQSNNPSFVLRNWVTDEVVDRLKRKDDTDFLSRILDMAVHPFAPWGEQTADGKTDADLAEERRLCSIGTPLSHNMPSCSS